MTREKKEALLAELVGVTPEEAQKALEASAWNMRQAAQLLWQERECARKAEIARARSRESGSKLGRVVRELLGRLRGDGSKTAADRP